MSPCINFEDEVVTVSHDFIDSESGSLLGVKTLVTVKAVAKNFGHGHGCDRDQCLVANYSTKKTSLTLTCLIKNFRLINLVSTYK